MKRRTFLTLIGGIVASAVALPLTGCSSVSLSSFGFDTPSVADAQSASEAAQTATVTSPTIKTSGTLTVGLITESDSAPFCIVEDSDAISGMDVDIASALADEMGLSVKFVSVTTAKQGIDAGCDIVMDVTSSDTADVKIVASYAQKAACLFHKDVEGVATTTQLSGKTVALQDGSTSQNTLSKTNLVMTQKTYSNLNEAFDALSAGSVDYVLCDAYSGGYLAVSYKGITSAGTIDTPTNISIAASASNTALQTAVSEAYQTISDNGILDLIRSRWVGDLSPLTSSSQVQGITTTASSSTATGSTETTESTSTSASGGTTAGANAATAIS